jgi:transcriptional regulator GlxA family with amidase domain
LTSEGGREKRYEFVNAKTKTRESGRLPAWPALDRLLRVVILATPDAQPLDVAGPHEIFSLAGRKLRELGQNRGRGYVVDVCTTGKGRFITGESGLSLLAKGSYSSLKGPIDTLLVTGGMDPWEPEGQEPLLDWLRTWAPRVRRIGSICTGAFVLAAAGLLDGRRATTHWYFCQQLAHEYPKVMVDPEPIFVRDGNVFTSAGVTAGMDLALALVEQDFGSDVAVRIARAYVMFLRRPGGQSQFSTPLSFLASSDSVLAKLQVWILENLHQRPSIEILAAKANMSPRNFSRVFTQQFNMTPGEYVTRLRVEAARKYLEETTDGVASIASKTGFRNAETMRRAFLRILDVNPNEYRNRFRGDSHLERLSS